MSNTVINAMPYPVRGQAQRVGIGFFNLTTGVLITGWTGASASVSTDSGATTSATITESPTNSGLGYVDLTASQMTASMVQLTASITNSGAIAVLIVLYPLDLTDYQSPNGSWDNQGTVRFEQIELCTNAVAMNSNLLNNNSNAIFTRAGGTKLTGTYSEGSDFANRGKLS